MRQWIEVVWKEMIFGIIFWGIKVCIRWSYIGYVHVAQCTLGITWLQSCASMQNLDDALKELEEVKAKHKLLSPAQLECASDP